MKPTVSGGAIGHGKLTVEWLGGFLDDVDPDSNGGGDEFQEVEGCPELKVDGNLETPGTTAVGESSNSLGTSIGAIHNGWAAEGAKV